MFKTFAHTADAGLWIEADDLNSLFVEAARALFSLIVANGEAVETNTELDVTVAGSDLEYLMVDWLSELLFVFESQQLLLREFQVAVAAEGLTATVAGEPADPERHRLENEVKAITYHDLKIEQLDGKWTARVIVDI